MNQKSGFRFRQMDVIGYSDAEEDAQFLEQCFVDTGDLSILRDCSNPRRILLGRTGSGKTALLNRLADSEERAIRVHPESLALSYITNSTILSYLSDLGVSWTYFSNSFGVMYFPSKF